MRRLSMTSHLRIATVFAIVGALAIVRASSQAPVSPVSSTQVDQVFSKWTSTTPGCAVGVSRNGSVVLERAYGMADLEYDVRNTPQTIFEAGSVSKQFTAAAILLLARDATLALDDPVRKYVPELPDYGVPLTIRHLLNHTSGLRDWGNVAAIAGWPRTTRVHTHAHVLDIVSRQKALNFTPGTRWSYSNTGYNLAAIIVSRVSGQPFAEFTRARIFEPLGMTHTSWRDDYTRVVKGRAIAYSQERDGFHADMPFENVHGNGGLLTTVGDLLKWTRNFSEPRVGDAAFVHTEQQPGRFNDGRAHNYAFGLFIGDYKGTREVQHSGSTAGYRAYLADYPDRKVSVAVLCNVGSGNATQYAHAVADVFLVGSDGGSTGVRLGSDRGQTWVRPGSDGGQTGVRQGSDHGGSEQAGSRAERAYTLTDADIKSIVGTFRSKDTFEPLTILTVNGRLQLAGADGSLLAVSSSRIRLPNGSWLERQGDGFQRIDLFGTVEPYERVSTAPPDRETLASYAGTYASDEAEVTMTAALDGDSLVLKRRPDSTLRLTPAYKDAFRAPIGLVRFRRDDRGNVIGLSVSQDRVWDLQFKRVTESTK
jgi:CubicO group peptidase (beta-lactamase class C family)